MNLFGVRGLWAGLSGSIVAALMSATLVQPAAAGSVILSDSTFSPGNITFTPSDESAGSIIAALPCGTCGVTGDGALQFVTLFETNSFGAVDAGLMDSSLTYDPLTQGAISGISASVLKSVFLTESGGFSSTFRPIIEQGGNYYLAAISLGALTGPANTGYLPASGLLHANDFVQFNFSTDTFGTAHPNFDGGTMEFGIAQLSSSLGLDTSIIDYDNLTFAITAVPEAPSWAMLLLGVGSIGVGLRLARRNGAARVAG